MKLVVHSGPEAGVEFSLDRPRTRLGRDSANDIVLSDTQASRHHAEIHRQADGYAIRDLDSTNGTFVNNEPVVAPRQLQPGDQIVYRGCAVGGKCGLVVAGADGARPRQITTEANDAGPRWSPNGLRLALRSDRGGSWSVWATAGIGGSATKILDAAADPDWMWARMDWTP